MSLLRIQRDCEDTARGLIIEVKNSKGEVVTSHSTYHTLNHRGESIATTLLS